MEEKLINFIRDEFVADGAAVITADTKLLSTGLIDSFSLVSLQVFIDKEFGKKIPAPRITVQSFDTVRQIMDVIAST